MDAGGGKARRPRAKVKHFDPVKVGDRLQHLCTLRDVGFVWDGTSYPSSRNDTPDIAALLLHARALKILAEETSSGFPAQGDVRQMLVNLDDAYNILEIGADKRAQMVIANTAADRWRTMMKHVYVLKLSKKYVHPTLAEITELLEMPEIENLVGNSRVPVAQEAVSSNRDELIRNSDGFPDFVALGVDVADIDDVDFNDADEDDIDVAEPMLLQQGCAEEVEVIACACNCPLCATNAVILSDTDCADQLDDQSSNSDRAEGVAPAEATKGKQKPTTTPRKKGSKKAMKKKKPKKKENKPPKQPLKPREWQTRRSWTPRKRRRHAEYQQQR